MSTHDTWILVSVPRHERGVPDLGRLATRAGIALIAWGGRPRRRAARSIDLHRVERTAAPQRPFC